ncbi:MAG: SpoIIE family protein phosphatase [Actinomycetota bacterium]|nr:SpoIIE family protein phosphatase [Actinomycetota bacterium]
MPVAECNPALDRLVELAARLVSASSAQISLLTAQQTVVAGAGLGESAMGGVGPLEESLCTVTAATAGPLIVIDAPVDERVAHLPPVTSGAVGAYLGVPLVTPGGWTVGALCVFAPTPRPWSPHDVGLLTELASSVMAELELSALTAEYATSRLRWDVAIEAAGIGSFDLDLRTDRVDWDDRLQAMFGYEPGEFVPHLTEAFSRIHPDDQPVVKGAVADAVEAGGDYRAEFRILPPGGSVRWIAARGRTRVDGDGRAVQLVGTAYDVTEVRTARDRAAHLLDTMATGFLSVDRAWRVTYLNATGERVMGISADELVGRDLWSAFPGMEELEFGQQCHHAVRTGESVEFEARYRGLDTWFEVRVVPSDEGLALYLLDITGRHAAQEQARVAQEQAEAAVSRLELLAAVSAELAATLRAEAAVARLARLVVPALGDGSIVSLCDEGHLRDVGWWHADPALRPALERYAAVRADALTTESIVVQALETGRPVVVPEDARAVIRRVHTPGEAWELLEALAPESAAFLPLRARGRTVGLLSLFRGSSRGGLTDTDLAIASEVAARAGLALDNALLYGQQRSLAEGLQTSLLTDPPEPDHCHIVVRYVPAAEAASVGGDWFDSFLQADGATVLVIGDVVGHDTEAAAAMGQVRGLLRGIAWYSGAGPAEVLSGLDAAMEGLAVDTTATAVVARLEQTRAESDRNVRVLRWSNAGHPPPLTVSPGRPVTVLDGVEPDLLLGIDARTRRVESTVTLKDGATVLLYTDGLVERRGQSLDEGIGLLRDTLADLADRPLDDLCDELLTRMLPERAEDDVALVALRLFPQDQPRPVEAGRRRVPPGRPPRFPSGAQRR